MNSLTTAGLVLSLFLLTLEIGKKQKVFADRFLIVYFCFAARARHTHWPEVAGFYPDYKMCGGDGSWSPCVSGAYGKLPQIILDIQGREVPFVPMPRAAVPAAPKHDLRRAFTIILRDTATVEKALILVEKINRPVFLLSATVMKCDHRPK